MEVAGTVPEGLAWERGIEADLRAESHKSVGSESPGKVTVRCSSGSLEGHSGVWAVGVLVCGGHSGVKAIGSSGGVTME